MEIILVLKTLAGPAPVFYRGDRVFINVHDRVWELITEEQYAERGNEKQHITYTLLGITPAMVDAAFMRWWEGFFAN